MPVETASLPRQVLRSARIAIPLLGLILVTLQWWQVSRLRDDTQSAQQTMLDIWRNHPPAFPLETLASSVYLPVAISPLAAFDSGDGPWLAQSMWMQLSRIPRAQDQLAFDIFSAGRQTGLSAALFAQYLIPCIAIFLAWRQVSAARARSFKSWLSLQTGMIEFSGPLLALCCLLTAVLERQSLGLDGAIRLMFLLATYLLYSVACGSLAWSVYQSWSSIPRSTTALVFFWLLNFTLARPLSANLASAVFALPSLDAFVSRFNAEIANGYKGVEPRPDRQRRFTAEILREFNANQPSEVPVNFSALLIKREEAHQREVGRRLRAELAATFERQERFEQAISVLLPLISIQLTSSSLAATDFASERRQFADADQFWERTLDRIYTDIARSSGPDATRVPRGADYWSQIPFLIPSIPAPSYSINNCLIPSAGLLLFSAAGIFFGLRRRPSPAIELPVEIVQ
jgi:hypothetical protein